jgi:hypothetical protein
VQRTIRRAHYLFQEEGTMRVFVRLGTAAVAMFALVAPLAAQGHGHEQGRTGGSGSRSEGRARSDDHQRGGDRGRVEARSHATGREWSDVRVRSEGRAGRDVHADVRERVRADIRTDGRGRAAVPTGAFRGRIDDRWRQANEFGMRRYFNSGHFGAFAGYRARLPFGWDRRVYLNGFFPVDYDLYLRPVPADLDYLLPPLDDGYARFVFGDRLVVMDRFSRRVVVMVGF